MCGGVNIKTTQVTIQKQISLKSNAKIRKKSGIFTYSFSETNEYSIVFNVYIVFEIVKKIYLTTYQATPCTR